MDKINPDTTKHLLEEIKNQDEKVIELDNIKIKTCKNVFPPQSKFSHSSIELHHTFGNLMGKTVLDVGTGTGIQAIRAAKMGAKRVIAIDINRDAIKCSALNVKNNKVEDIVQVIESDLFQNIGNEKFDLIIANLPITDYPITGIVESSLYDPDYELHRKFLERAKSYLVNNGFIVIAHIDFKGKNDFIDFEDMIRQYEYKIIGYEEIEAIGYKWRYYRIGV